MRRFFALSALLAVVPAVASAHAFGQQYTLPLPVTFYIVGGVCAFIASCAVIFLFSNPITESVALARIWRFKHPRGVARTLRATGLLIFAYVILVSCLGSQKWFENPVVELFWIVLMLGITYASVFVDGLWRAMNPFKTLSEIVVGGSAPREETFTLGYAPAIILYFELIWLELFSQGLGIMPFTLGTLFLAYTILCFIGSRLYGVEAWFEHAEVFGVFFGVIGKIAPFELTSEGVRMTRPTARLVREHAASLSLVFFILCMLASTAVDGLKETVPWNALLSGTFPQLSSNTFGSIALVLLPAVFFMLYAGAVITGKHLARAALSSRELLLKFGYSLIPIAVAYHFAHYFTSIVTESQRLLPLLSDPLHRGWNLIGTANYQPNYLLIGADTVWYIQLTTIVVGHIIAASVAHRIAVRTFATKREIILSQLPMLVLMVFYTAFGLWILSLPFAPGV